jgi:hypothetical protein
LLQEPPRERRIPGPEFAIGLAAGIILDATVIRALLVPAFMRLLAGGEAPLRAAGQASRTGS